MKKLIDKIIRLFLEVMFTYYFPELINGLEFQVFTVHYYSQSLLLAD